MKKIIIYISLALLPIYSNAFDLFNPIEVPNSKQYLIYSKESITPKLPNSDNAVIDASLLVYNIQTQAATATRMFYMKDNEVHEFADSSWISPVGKMLTVALFEYMLDKNIVSKLAYQDLNIRQDFTLSGTTPYGPVIDLDNNIFILYITFYLTNEKTNDTQIKTFKYEKTVTDSITVQEYVKLSNIAVGNIFNQLAPWLTEEIKNEKMKKAPILLPILKTTSD